LLNRLPLLGGHGPIIGGALGVIVLACNLRIRLLCRLVEILRRTLGVRIHYNLVL
jgi:hypothetical protein